MVRRIKVESVKGNEEITVEGIISIRSINRPSNVKFEERDAKLNEIKSDIEKLILEYLSNIK